MHLVSEDPLRNFEVNELADDVIEARESILDNDGALDESNCFVFNPKTFQEEHSVLALANFEMNEDALYQQAKIVTTVRRMFAEKADMMYVPADASSRTTSRLKTTS